MLSVEIAWLGVPVCVGFRCDESQSIVGDDEMAAQSTACPQVEAAGCPTVELLSGEKTMGGSEVRVVTCKDLAGGAL